MKYEAIGTESGYAVRRGDGWIAEFLDSSEADEATRLLLLGDASETDYDWRDVDGYYGANSAKAPYTMHCGNTVAHSDDDGECFAASPEEALRNALEWADESWPDSDVSYAAVVWVARDGEIVAQQDVVISADGTREE